jgi:hypothetical protein
MICVLYSVGQDREDGEELDGQWYRLICRKAADEYPDTWQTKGARFALQLHEDEPDDIYYFVVNPSVGHTHWVEIFPDESDLIREATKGSPLSCSHDPDEHRWDRHARDATCIDCSLRRVVRELPDGREHVEFFFGEKPGAVQETARFEKMEGR